jgi:hypothetical protein
MSPRVSAQSHFFHKIFNAFNNKAISSPLSSHAPFNFSGFLWVGVGDPLQAQLVLRFVLRRG